MVLFLGDSFTWGQGLEWELMISESKNTSKTINLINRSLTPPKEYCEHLPIKYQEFRETHRFPKLISNHFDVQHCVGRFGNSGNNYDNKFILENLNSFIIEGTPQLIVFQFTNPVRIGSLLTKEQIEKLGYVFDKEKIYLPQMNTSIFEENVRSTLELIDDKFKEANIIFLSWLPEIGECFKKMGREDIFCKIDYNDKSDYGFEFLLQDDTIGNQTCLRYKHKGLRDAHLSIEGHKVVADSLIKKITDMGIEFNRPLNKIFI